MVMPWFDLDGDEPVPMDYFDPRIDWDAVHLRRWAQQQRDKVGDCDVSTVFLAIDHNWPGLGPPVLWETMIFGGPHDSYQWRYCTATHARAHHAAILDALQTGRAIRRGCYLVGDPGNHPAVNDGQET